MQHRLPMCKLAYIFSPLQELFLGYIANVAADNAKKKKRKTIMMKDIGMYECMCENSREGYIVCKVWVWVVWIWACGCGCGCVIRRADDAKRRRLKTVMKYECVCENSREG